MNERESCERKGDVIYFFFFLLANCTFLRDFEV